MDIDEMRNLATRASALEAALKINPNQAAVVVVLDDAADIYRWLKDGKLPEQS